MLNFVFKCRIDLRSVCYQLVYIQCLYYVVQTYWYIILCLEPISSLTCSIVLSVILGCSVCASSCHHLCFWLLLRPKLFSVPSCGWRTRDDIILFVLRLLFHSVKIKEDSMIRVDLKFYQLSIENSNLTEIIFLSSRIRSHDISSNQSHVFKWPRFHLSSIKPNNAMVFRHCFQPFYTNGI